MKITQQSGSSSTIEGALTTYSGVDVVAINDTGIAADLAFNLGKTIDMPTGTNAARGTGAVLVGGTVTVSTTAVRTGDHIDLMCTAAGGTQGIPRVSTITNATSFVITSSSGTDTSTYSWKITH